MTSVNNAHNNRITNVNTENKGAQSLNTLTISYI